MRYFVTIAGRTFTVDLSGDVPRVDGEAIDADVRTVPGTALRHVLANHRSFSALVREAQPRGNWAVHLDGRRWMVQVLDERTRQIRELTGRGAAPAGPKPVRAPMPGLVVRVEVEAGQIVQAGQGVVIVEAMKMENELKAEVGGVVSKILVQAGQPVEKGAVLVEFEADV